MLRPYDALGLPHDEMDDIPGVPRDHDARPGLDEVLALRADRMAVMRTVLDEMTDERLAGRAEPVAEVGYPSSESFPVCRCLECILWEEWNHRSFAERDPGVLESRLRAQDDPARRLRRIADKRHYVNYWRRECRVVPEEPSPPRRFLGWGP